MKSFNSDQSGIKIGVGLQKLSHRDGVGITAASQGDVRMPGMQFDLETGAQRRFMDPLVHLKKMRMAAANSDPNDFEQTPWWKTSQTENGQKKGAELDRAQFFPKPENDFLGHISKKAQSQMDLVRVGPTNAPDLRIEIGQCFLNRRWQIDSCKEALGHFPRNVQPSSLNVQYSIASVRNRPAPVTTILPCSHCCA